MNKKGFTLVELLAVIAILAILVIIALPNIMSMFNQARKNSFTTEIKEIYKVAEQQWISDSLFTTSEKVYSRCESCTGKSLDMSGRTQLEYYIRIDKSGKVVEYYATDGSYQYSFNNSSGLKIEDITDVDTVADLQPNQVLNIASDNVELGESYYLYSSEGSLFLNGEPNTTEGYYIFPTYQEALNNNPLHYTEATYVRGKVIGGVVKELAVGFVYNGTPYYIIGVDPSKYEQNVQLLTSLLPAENCETASNLTYFQGEQVEERSIVCRFPASGPYPSFQITSTSTGFAGGMSLESNWLAQVGHFVQGWAANCDWE